jgi:His/Glu/Gln/Arg/opine family amino acid ABC transporter permease subunit
MAKNGLFATLPIWMAIFWLFFSLFAPKVEASEPAQLTVALTGKYPPFSFYDQNGELSGFDVDISRRVAQELGMELKIIATEWDGILAGLLTGKFDAIIGSMAITAEREKQVDFSRPYYVSGAQLFVNAENGTEISSINDLAGRRVGAVLGETFEHYLTENHPQIETVTYKSTVDIYQDMLNGRLDGFVTDRLVGGYQIKSAQMPFRPAGSLLYREQMGIPLAPGHPVLLARINQALDALESSGFMANLQSKWFGPAAANAAARSPEMSNQTIAMMMLKGFGVTIAIACLSLLCGFMLAVPAGVVLHGKSSLLMLIVRTMVDFVRGTPVLIQLFFVYFGAPQIGLTISPVTSAIITLSINGAAYMAEVVRSGLMAVPPGQKLAARALGLSHSKVFRFVVWPQAFRIAIPSLVNSAVALLKDTALVSVISVAEVVRQAQSIISVTYNPMKFYFIVALMFFVFTYPLMKFAGRWENALKKRGYADD